MRPFDRLRATQGANRNQAQFDWGWLAVLASLTFAIYPLLRKGLPSVADATIHLYRTAEWVRIWQDGILYPRWAPNLAFGHGFPLFIFAPPLPYVIAGALHLLGLSLDVSAKALPVLGFILMALGMYLLARDVLGWRAGVISAAAFVYTTFQLREAYLYGGNYPQFLAVAMFPWMLWTFRRAVLHNRLSDLLMAGIVYAALTLNHNFHAFIFTPVTAVYVLGLAAVERRWSSLWRALAAGILGLVLSAAFWLPALYERQWSLAHEGFYVVRSNFQLRFLSWQELLAWPEPLDAGAANPYLPFALGWGIIILAALGLLALLISLISLAYGSPPEDSQPYGSPPVHGGNQGGRQQRYHLIFFSLLLIVALFMVLPVSVSIWESAPLLATAEFPWRVLGLVALSLSFLAGGSLCWLQTPLLKKIRAGQISAASLTALAVLLIIVATLVYTYPPKPFTVYGTPSLADAVRYELTTQTIGSTTLGEYLPRWVKQRPLTSQMIDDYEASRPPVKLDRSALPEGASAELVEHTAAGDVYDVSSPAGWTMTLYTFYYPGWVASVDGEPVGIVIDEPRGLISIPVPAGEHRVAVRFENIPMRTFANAISLLGWILALGGLVYSIVWAKKTRAASPKGSDSSGRDRSGPLYESAVIAGIILLAFVLRIGIIDPFTGWFRRHSPPGQVIGAQYPTAINFGNKIALLGYDLRGEPATQGGTFHIRLYWEALEAVGEDYSSFVHLDALPDLTTRAQSDNVHPGDARAQIDVPARNWTPGTYVRDEHTIQIPADMPPIGYALHVGLYDRQGNRLPVIASQVSEPGEEAAKQSPDKHGEVLGDAAFLQVLHVLPQHEPDLQDAGRQSYRLGEHIELIGARVESASLQFGEPLRVHLFWRASAPLSRDYTVFVHVLDENGSLVAQGDGPPLGGAYPTSWWQPGQIIEDVREVSTDELGPGAYRLAAGMYDPESGERLPVAGGDEATQIMLEQTVEVSH